MRQPGALWGSFWATANRLTMPTARGSAVNKMPTISFIAFSFPGSLVIQPPRSTIPERARLGNHQESHPNEDALQGPARLCEASDATDRKDEAKNPGGASAVRT
jgi:hypothetical protein